MNFKILRYIKENTIFPRFGCCFSTEGKYLLLRSSCIPSHFLNVGESSLKNVVVPIAIAPPVCIPNCGLNAHCEYGAVNQCVCNPSTSGNPYKECGTQGKSSCASNMCGAGAVCKETSNGIACACPAGFRGNPYIRCEGRQILSEFS